MAREAKVAAAAIVAVLIRKAAGDILEPLLNSRPRRG